MRTISSASLAKVTQQYGAEPINIVEIEWTDGAQRASYADRDLDGGAIKGRITEISGLDFIIKVSDGSDSAEISITLSDVDGDLKNIIDTVDVHKRDVWVYQWFEGLLTSEKFLIFRGEINSPIIWNEGDRTLSFSVITKIEDAEIGFSIEEGQFEVPDPSLIGKAWPLKFGTTINVPALRFTTPRKGVLATGVGIKDFTLVYRREKADSLTCPSVFRGFTAEYGGPFNRSLIITPLYTPDENCVLSICNTIQNLDLQIQEQSKYEFLKIEVIDGELFPQGVELTLNIGGGKFTGSFQGTTENPSNIFVITSREHPDLDEIGIPTDQSVTNLLKQKVTEAVESNCGGAAGGDEHGFGGFGVTVGINEPHDPSRKGVETSERRWAFFNAIPTASFFWAEPGTEVTIDSGEPTVYASNLIPETVHRVAAFRSFNGGVRKLVTIPASLYTTRITDFQSYNVSEIVLNRPLSQLGDGWEDDIYVTSTSSVGPNTVNIMEWLIGKYTNLATDVSSFNDVRSKVAVYPMDFPYLDRRNILQALQELAFQARCAIYLRDGKFFLKYLPELAASDDTITESDVDANTLELSHSDTEDIVTKLIAEWKRDYSLDENNSVILRHNIKKYGTQEDTFDFYAFNELDYVHKSATFWLIRKSNTWRKLRFETPIQKLALETFDTVDLTLPDIASGTIPGLIEKANYNSDGRALEFEVWTPVRSGSTVVYDFAHPHDIDQTLQWPTEEDRDQQLIGSGDAPGFSTAPPSGHPTSGTQAGLFQGFSLGPCASQGLTAKSFSDQTCGNGNGDTYPSDTGDTVKEKDLVGGAPPDSPVDPGEIQVGDGPVGTLGGETEIEQLNRQIEDLERAVRNAQTIANEANEAAGGDGSGSGADGNPSDLPDQEELEDSTPEGESACLYFSNVQVHRANILFQTGDTGFKDTGFLGASDLVQVDKWIFKSCEEAQAFTLAIQAQFQSRQDAEDIEKGEVLPVNATTFCPAYNPPCDECNPNPSPRGFEGSPEEGEDFTEPDYQNGLPDFFPPPTECPEE